jgi:C1A family cysteine protease
MKMKTTTLLILFMFQIPIFAQVLPETFDLRDHDGYNYVTSVKSQIGGTCWTHGVMAAIEGNLLKNGNWTNAGLSGQPDLSEYHLDWWNGFNSEFNQDTLPDDGTGLDVHYGGDYRVTSAYLSRGEGAINDTTDYSAWHANPPARKSDRYYYFYVRDIDWYTLGDSLNRIETIKTKIMENGVMGTCMAYSSQFISQYMHYQPQSSDMEPNHAIAIIGWDDNIDVGAPYPGAWLCKNSWGADWGNSGYFWISYYDKWAARHPEMGAVSLYNVVEPFFDTVYYHDYHGWRDTKTEVKKAMNVFTAHDTLEIIAASFYTAADSVNYTLKVYDSFDGDNLSGELITEEGFIAHTGFHTIDLSNSALINMSDKFYLYLELDKGGQPFDRTSEIPVLLGSSKTRTIVRSTSRRGQSYYNDADGNWVDFYDEGEPEWINSGNFCMKAIVNYASGSVNGIQDMGVENNIEVYPQPVLDLVTLRSSSPFNGSVRIFNANGQLMHEINLSSAEKVNINMNHWGAGVYFYEVKNASGIQRGKIIKQ